jgi:multiple sugar transport system permease protein
MSGMAGRRRHLGRRALLHTGAILASLFFLLPVLVAVFTSLKSDASVFTRSSLSLPRVAHFGNYLSVITVGGFGRFLENSAIVACCGAGIQVVVTTMAGYSLARLPFRGRRAIFWLVLLTLMLPPTLLIVALFLLIDHVPLAGGNGVTGTGGTGLLNTYPGLIAPYVISGIGVFLMRQFFIGLPRELEDSGRVDGCSEWKVFSRLFLPQVRPAVWIVLLFSFQAAWLDLLWPLLVAKTPALFTVQVGLTVFQQEYTAEWPLIMASAIISSLPVVVIFLFAQRRLEQGLVFSGLK